MIARTVKSLATHRVPEHDSATARSALCGAFGAWVETAGPVSCPQCIAAEKRWIRAAHLAPPPTMPRPRRFRARWRRIGPAFRRVTVPRVAEMACTVGEED